MFVFSAEPDRYSKMVSLFGWWPRTKHKTISWCHAQTKLQRWGVFPHFPPTPALRWAERHTAVLSGMLGMFYLQSTPTLRRPAKRKEEWLQPWYSLIVCWHSAAANEAWGSSTCKETPHCHPSSHGTEHVTLLLMVSFPEGLRGGCPPSSWFCFECLEGFHRAWGGQGDDTSSLTIFLCHTITPMREKWLERLQLWVMANCSLHTSPHQTLSQPQNMLWTQDAIFPLWAQGLMATNSSQHWWTLVPPRAPSELVSMMPGRWTQHFLLLNCLNKRKISCDYFHNKPVSINWDSYCSGTEVLPCGQGHQLKRVLIAQGINSSGYQ